MSIKSINFHENHLSVRTMESDADKIAAYKLRHKVYCEHLQWVSSSAGGLEIDEYDQKGIIIGAFRESGELAATMRFILADSPFMLEKEFSSLLLPNYVIQKGRHSAEVTRLATLGPIERNHTANIFTLDVIFKGMYVWSIANDIRRLYFVVVPSLLRLMQMRSFPCKAIGPARALTPGGSQCVAVLLDWNLMKSQTGSHTKDHYLNWLRSVEDGVLEDGSRFRTSVPVFLADSALVAERAPIF